MNIEIKDCKTAKERKIALSIFNDFEVKNRLEIEKYGLRKHLSGIIEGNNNQKIKIKVKPTKVILRFLR